MSYYVPVRRFQRPDQPQPVYPRVVDATVAKWAGIWRTQRDVSELPPARPVIDMFRHQWSPEFGWPFKGITDSVVRTWAPIWKTERESERSRERVPGVDTIRTEFRPQFAWDNKAVDNTVQKWAWIWNQQHLAERSRGCPPLDMLRADWDPQFTWSNNVTDTGVSKWAGIWRSQTLAERSRERATLDMLRSDWDPIFSWVYPVTPVDFSILWPAILQSSSISYRSADNVRMDVVEPEWRAWFDPFQVTDDVVSGWAPVFSQQLKGARTPDVAPFDVRGHEWTPGYAGWAQKVVDTGVSKFAATWALQAGALRSASGPALSAYRHEWSQQAWVQRQVDGVVALWIPAFEERVGMLSADRPKFDVHPQWSPQDGWVQRQVDSVTALWTPAFEGRVGARSADKPKFDVRQHWSPQDGWTEPVVEGIISKYAPVWNEQAKASRSADAPVAEVRYTDLSSFAWVFANLTFGPTAAQILPALLQALGLTAFGTQRRAVHTEPQFGWSERVVESIIGTYAPVWGAQANTFRGVPGPVLDVRQLETSIAWIFANLTFGPTAAQIWPAILQALGSFLNVSKQGAVPADVMRLEWLTDVLVRTWSPIWAMQAHSHIRIPKPAAVPMDQPRLEWLNSLLVSTWAPVWMAQPSFRVGSGPVLDITGTYPQQGWQAFRGADDVVARFMPAILAQPSFRSNEGARLDVLSRDQSAQFGWVERVAEDGVALWVPAWTSELHSGGRTRPLHSNTIPTIPGSTVFPISIFFPAPGVIDIIGSYVPLISLTGSYTDDIELVGNLIRIIQIIGGVRNGS